MLRLVKATKDDPKATALLVKKRNADGWYFRNHKTVVDAGPATITKKDFKNDIEEFEFRSNINYIYFDDGYKSTFDEELQSYKYLFLLFEPTKDKKFSKVIYFKAWMGDALRYALNQVRAGSQGVIVRESSPGYNAIFSLLTELKNHEVRYQIIADTMAFLEATKCDTSSSAEPGSLEQTLLNICSQEANSTTSSSSTT